MNLGSSVNGSNWEQTPNISADGLTLYFISNRSGDWDIWVTTRETMDSPWPDAVNLGPTVNSSSLDADPTISADGLSIYFVSNRPGGYGEWDIWVSRRETKDSLWAAPVNLGSTVNSSATEHSISISPDGLSLFFGADQPGGHGEADLWVTLRATVSDTWGEPVNLGPTVNSSVIDLGPSISADGSTLYFFSARAGGVGIVSLWQASIEPVVDLNHDGIVDATDMCIIVDNWHTENSLCDIAPAPFGDGLVDVKDLIVLAEHLFEETPLSE